MLIWVQMTQFMNLKCEEYKHQASSTVGSFLFSFNQLDELGERWIYKGFRIDIVIISNLTDTGFVLFLRLYQTDFGFQHRQNKVQMWGTKRQVSNLTPNAS